MCGLSGLLGISKTKELIGINNRYDFRYIELNSWVRVYFLTKFVYYISIIIYTLDYPSGIILTNTQYYETTISVCKSTTNSS